MVRTALLIGVLAALAPRPSDAAEGRVTYVTSRTVYVDVGSAAGLVVGASVEVRRDGERLGTAVVKELSSTRAACVWTNEDLPEIGDVVRFVPTVVDAPGPEDGATWFERNGLRGRIGLQSLHLRDRSQIGDDLDRPALDVRLRGQNVASTGLGLEVDVRARRTRTAGDERSVTRVYRLGATGGDEDRGVSWAVGRQFAPAVSVLHLFDGVRVQYAWEGWAVGALGGTQPEPGELALSSQVVEGGAWAGRHSTGGAARWSLTAAAIASYDGGSIDREFVYLQGFWSALGVTARVDQEFDLNRGWKHAVGEPVIGVTSTLATLRWNVDRRWSLHVGLDNRRSVRRIRDRETPLTEFDDAYRRGAWVGVRARRLLGIDAGLRLKTRGGANAGSADAVTLDLGRRSGLVLPWRVSSRTTVYRNELVEGWLQSLRLHARVTDRVDLGAFGGLRHESGRSNDLMDGDDPWFGVDADLSLRRDLWFSASWERTFEGEEAFEQFWFGVGLRF